MKRLASACLAAAIACATVMPHLTFSAAEPDDRRYFGDYWTSVGDATDPSWSESMKDIAQKAGYAPTGLSFAQLVKDTYGFWSHKQGDTNVEGDFNYEAFDGILMYCVDQHTEDSSRMTYDQAFSAGILRMDENGDLINKKTGEKDSPTRRATNKKFTTLMIIAALGFYSDWKEAIDKDGYFNKPEEVESYLNQVHFIRDILWSLTDEDGYTGDWETDLARFNATAHGWESLPPHEDPVAAALGLTAYHHYFWPIWMAAKMNYGLSFDENGEATKAPASSVANADGSVTNSYDFGKELVEAGIQNILDVQVNGGTYNWDAETGMLTVTAPAGVEVSGTVEAKGGSWDGQLKGSIPNFGTAKIARFHWPTVWKGRIGFDQSQNFMSVVFTDTYRFSFGGELPPESEVVVHRYDHEETWNADYNIRLYKFDSETGQPLQGSHFDVLEKFDETQLERKNLELDSKNAEDDIDIKIEEMKEKIAEVPWLEDQKAQGGQTSPDGSGEPETSGARAPARVPEEPGTDGSEERIKLHYDGDLGVLETNNTLVNWANDIARDGSQFDKWDDPHQDPCPRDDEITNADGGLGTNGTGDIGSPAHSDSRTYTYHKGFCGGHPAPEIQYVPCTHGGGTNCACGRTNQQLHDEAWGKWLDEVQTCIELANEGGYFHAIDEGAAQKAMEEDRDQFYKDFTSLTYDYSAEETKARLGYVLHGYHPDDIPIEWRAVTSSQYKDWNSRGELNHTGGQAEGGDDHETVPEPDMESPANRIADAASPDVDYDPIVIGSHGKAAGGQQGQADLPDIVWEDGGTDPDGLGIGDVEDEDVPDAQPGGTTGATPSDAPGQDGEPGTGDGAWDAQIGGTHAKFSFRRLANGAKNLFSWISGSLTKLVDLDGPDVGPGDENLADEGPAGGTGADHEELVTEESVANLIDLDDADTIDWTFVVYDHRSEGEIHINKRDLNLSDDAGDGKDFDDYATENGDGSLEGAVYGLYAQTDIVHPDGNTDVVYKAGDLVAIAMTDRNGDASFMAYTETPHTHYDYKTGKTVTYESEDPIPTNMHRKQEEATKVEDIEKFQGRTWDNQEIPVGDGEDGLKDTSSHEDGDETWYKKHSTNQGYESTSCDAATTQYYPISDNETNNGNCWIGRPLIVSGTSSASYYVKELSRSEGYELSVAGKDAEYTNRYADLDTGEKTVALDVSAISKGGSAGDGIRHYNEFTVHSEGTSGYRVEMKNVPSAQPRVYLVKEETVYDENAPAGEIVIATRSEPVRAIPGNFVYIEGQKKKAEVGQEIELPNGEKVKVQAVSPTDPLTLTVMPGNQITVEEMPEIKPTTTNGTLSSEEDWKKLVAEYNEGLFKESMNLHSTYAKTAPYFLVDLSDANSYEIAFRTLNEDLKKHKLFNRFYVQEIKDISGKKQAVVRYTYMEGASTIPVAIYDAANKTIYNFRRGKAHGLNRGMKAPSPLFF